LLQSYRYSQEKNQARLKNGTKKRADSSRASTSEEKKCS